MHERNYTFLNHAMKVVSKCSNASKLETSCLYFNSITESVGVKLHCFSLKTVLLMSLLKTMLVINAQ